MKDRPSVYTPTALRNQAEETPRDREYTVVREGQDWRIQIAGPWPILEEALEFIPLNDTSKEATYYIAQSDSGTTSKAIYTWVKNQWVRL